MDQLDRKAIETAQKALSGGRFDWQAYLLLAVSEIRSGKAVDAEERYSAEPQSYGKFEMLLSDYDSGSDKAFLSILSFFESGMSELVSNSTGERRSKAVEACKRLASMQ